jgi:hypothetical protein
VWDFRGHGVPQFHAIFLKATLNFQGEIEIAYLDRLVDGEDTQSDITLIYNVFDKRLENLLACGTRPGR